MNNPDSSALDVRAQTPGIKAQVLHDWIETHPIMQLYRRFQGDCITKARDRNLPLSDELTDRQVWDNLC